MMLAVVEPPWPLFATFTASSYKFVGSTEYGTPGVAAETTVDGEFTAAGLLLSTAMTAPNVAVLDAGDPLVVTSPDVPQEFTPETLFASAIPLTATARLDTTTNDAAPPQAVCMFLFVVAPKTVDGR
jgi:hypothetical protein